MLGFMAITGFFGLGNLQKIEAEIIMPDEMYAGIPATAQLLVRNASRRSPRFLLDFLIAGNSTLLPWLKKGGSSRCPITLIFSERGAGTIERIAVTSRFPVNFFVRSASVHTASPFVVFPAPLPLPSDSLPTDEPDNLAGQNRHKRSSSGEMESVGLYSGREPLKQLHWKLSARHDELYVKKLQSEAGKPVVVDPDELHGDLEERLSQACHLINSLSAAGRAVGLTIGSETFAPSSNRSDRLKMLSALACYDPA
jgi:uncharacterized protein (DUF58 family)